MEVRRSKLRWIIKVLCVVVVTVHLLSYIYYVPEGSGQVYNPYGELQRGSIYLLAFLLCQFAILKDSDTVFYIISSIMLCLVWNEIVKKNQDWGFWQFFGFIGALMFPFIENKLMKHIDLKK